MTGIVSGTTFSLCFIITYCRLPLYFIEVLIQMVCWVVQNRTHQSTLRFIPVLHHNLSYFPHPFLMQHLVESAQESSVIVKQILDACAIAPGQRQIGQIALFHLQAIELADQVRKHQFNKMIELQGVWLPGVEGAGTLLLTLRDIARYLQAANTATVTYQRLKHLERASHIFATLGIRLLVEVSPFARALRATLPTWKEVIDEMREVTRVVSRRELPNPFRAGEPLTPEQGSEVFKGREEIVERIEFLIVDPRNSHSIALLGPRRCGKTSLLNMLPVMLPDTVCIFFDLQDNPIDSPAGFFQALAYRAQEQARRDRRLELPGLPPGSPFEAGSQWLQSLDKIAGEQRILLCIDEFERLEDIFPGERRELLQLMGLFRATIQHRRYLRLLIAGAAPFNELDSIWSDHFINLQEVRIGHLSHKIAIELLTTPIPDFPGKAISLEVSELIFNHTGGQPYLLQLYGSLLVQHLNSHKRKHATVADVEFVATYYFRNTVQVAPRTVQIALQHLAEGNAPTMSKHTCSWLQQRCLLDADNALLIPVLGKWIQEYW
ncbi:MAG: hypothetical protein BWK79_12800 [Beggiatoa sp. IS2]|nr:MAG: hypothetical protein BWK79_12800 [Beggiatoa sp. IS2]